MCWGSMPHRGFLNNTGIHPESYPAARKLLKEFDIDIDDIRHSEGGRISIGKRIQDYGKTAAMLGIGEPTLRDMVKDLEHPGRDPRSDMPAPVLRNDVLDIKDLKEGMKLKGTVRNIVDFGAFVDIGVHQDGLVHISRMSEKFVKHSLDVVSVGDVVDVTVVSVDMTKGRISLSMLSE